MGTKAIQMIHVLYMVKPMYLASLKFSGTFLVLMAYQVHKKMRKALYNNDIAKELVDTPHVKTATYVVRRKRH